MTATLWQAAQVAERLAMTPAAFRQRRRRLETDHGFPSPVPGLGLRWNPVSIEAWLARETGQQQEEARDDVLIARARAMMAA
jgi:predicted DNA-binding transcriptional regulator AlpA